MVVFAKYIIFEFKLLIKKFYITIPLLLSYIYIYYVYITLNDQLDIFCFIRLSGYVMMGVTIISIYSGVISAKQEKSVKLDELMNTLPAFWRRHTAKLLAWSIITAVYCLLLAVLCISLSAGVLNNISKYGPQFLIYISVNFGIPMISTWLIAYSVEKTLKPIIGWPILLVIWYSILPFERNLYGESVQLMLNQFVEQPYGNSRLLHYGLEMNFGLLSRKIWLLMFGMFLYIFTSLLKVHNLSLRTFKSKTAAAISLLMLVSSIPLAIISATPHSQGLIWENSDMEDNLLEQAKENYKPEYLNGETTFLGINLDESKDDLLRYDAKILISNVSKKTLIFTLYRTLEITDVKVNGQFQEHFVRDNDWIILDNNLAGNIEICFSVTGTLPYSLGEISDRTMLLTPDFPWYPILGRHKVLHPILDYAYFSNDLSADKPYDIEINSSRGNIITNLSYTSGIHFKGTATGPAIIQGEYKSENLNGIHFVAPTSMFNFYKNTVNVIPGIFSNYKKEFANKLDKKWINKLQTNYNQIFLVDLPPQQQSDTFRSCSSELYINYLKWVYPFYNDNPDKATEKMCEGLKTDFLYEHFFRNGELTKQSSIPAYYFRDIILLWEMDDKALRVKDLEQWFKDNDFDKEKNKIIWDNDIDDINEIERLINAKSKTNINKIAYEILNKWITISKEK